MVEFMNIKLASKPKKISESENEGRYEIVGLYPGYGHTFGNSLRRMLLSSIPGTAITQLKIKGADHEFTTLDGIMEDVLSIILNIKKIRTELLSEEFPQVITLKKKGKGTVTAADFNLPGQVRITNPETYIAEITDDKAGLEIEATIERGIGFCSRSEVDAGADVGVIALDATFSPIRRAAYEVTDMRVGNRTDYNKIVLHIETDGSIPPGEALQKSIRTMMNQLEAMLGFEVKHDAPAEKKVMTEVKKMSISELDITPSLASLLEKNGIQTISDLISHGEGNVRAFSGVGEKAVKDIEKALAQHGFSFEE